MPAGMAAFTRVTVAAIVVGAWLLAATVAHARGPCAVEFWVAPDGDDGATGDRTHPFRTIGRARDALRGRGPGCRAVVNVGGTHRLTEPLRLDPRDSGSQGHEVVYRAAPGTHPVISGAVRVRGFTLHDPRAASGGRRSEPQTPVSCT